MSERIKTILMERDGMSESDADDLITQCKEDMEEATTLDEVEDLISMAQLSMEERNWNEANEISQKILTIDPENHIGFASLIKSMIGLNQFLDVREIIDALSTEIKESKPVMEALKSLEPSEKAFKAQENIEDLEKKLALITLYSFQTHLSLYVL